MCDVVGMNLCGGGDVLVSSDSKVLYGVRFYKLIIPYRKRF